MNTRVRGSYGDVVLAIGVVAVVGTLTIPMPTFVLDLLLACNTAIAVLLLVVALYARDPLAIGSLPSLLLVTTLFRLSLGVSSARLVLLQADAGEVIEAFGRFVVGGSYVVGAVVFLLVTVVQFVVVAKGSERVSEVAARFALDAMPGRQMAIDAEQRIGAIDAAEAKRRRRALHRESQFYGAMDGAMKFVKGDVVAGVIVALVNVAGGLAVGVLQRGMDVGRALRVYGLLAIGDGLVSQLPSLLVATAAGLVVTRVASDDPEARLGADLGAELMGQPRALAVAAALIGALALVPGLPLAPFGVVAAALGALAVRAHRRAADAESRAASDAQHARPSAPLPVVAPLLVELADDVCPGAPPGLLGEDLLGDALARVRAALFHELGVPVPAVRVRARGTDLAPGRCRVRLHEVPVVEAAVERADAAGDVARRVGDVVRAHAGELLGLDEVQALVDALEHAYPALVRLVVPKPVTVHLLTDVLRRLVEEGVAVRNLREILQTLAQVAAAERDVVALTEHVRAGLRRQLTHRYTGGTGTLAAFLLAPEIEAAVRDAIQRTSAGNYLAMDPELSRGVVCAVLRAVQGAAPGVAPVVVTQADVRRYVKRLLAVEAPDVVVLSFQELLPEVVVQPLARIGV